MEKTSTCFVIMPFGDTTHGNPNERKTITSAQWAHIYENWIKKAVESYQTAKIRCTRSSAKPGNFIKGIVADLATADLVVADLTGARPNVYYELGIRHALRIGTIIITQDREALPSDLSSYFVVYYEYSEKAHDYDDYYRKFEKKMHDIIKASEASEDPFDNPVSDFLQIKDQLLEKDLEIEKDKLKVLLKRLKKELNHNFSVCEQLLKAGQGEDLREFEGLMAIDPFPIETIYNRILSLDWLRFQGADMEALEDFIVYNRRIFVEVDKTFFSLQEHVLQEQRMHPQLTPYFLKLLTEVLRKREGANTLLDYLISSVDTMRVVKGKPDSPKNK